jgi:hypothetical protein
MRIEWLNAGWMVDDEVHGKTIGISFLWLWWLNHKVDGKFAELIVAESIKEFDANDFP